MHSEVKGGGSPPHGVIAERTKHFSIPGKSCRVGGVFCGHIREIYKKINCYSMIVCVRIAFCLSGLKNCTYFPLYDFSMIMANKNGLSKSARGENFFRKKKSPVILNRNFSSL